MSSFLLTAVEQEEEKKNLTCKGENSFRNYLQVRKVKKKKKVTNETNASTLLRAFTLFSTLFSSHLLHTHTKKCMYIPS